VDGFSTLPREHVGTRHGPWTRRAVVALFTLVAVLGLLNLFGQRTSDSTAAVPAVAMTLSAPRTVRGGLFFQARIDIRARQAIQHPRLVLNDGWFEGMQFNSTEPQAAGEAGRDGKVVLSYDSLAAGDHLRIWVQFEANPTSVGTRSFGLELDDATTPVARIARDITVLP
jgi:hypothetical protein